MFEKDAEEYVHKDGTEAEELLNTIDLSLTKRQAFVLINICKQCFKNGAEFGYNKANEWHYVKDGLPDHNGQFYVALKGQTETFILNYDYDEEDESKMVWLDDDDTNFDDEVYAWREKPKAPKESE